MRFIVFFFYVESLDWIGWKQRHDLPAWFPSHSLYHPKDAGICGTFRRYSLTLTTARTWSQNQKIYRNTRKIKTNNTLPHIAKLLFATGQSSKVMGRVFAIAGRSISYFQTNPYTLFWFSHHDGLSQVNKVSHHGWSAPFRDWNPSHACNLPSPHAISSAVLETRPQLLMARWATTSLGKMMSKWWAFISMLNCWRKNPTPRFNK